MQDTPSASSPRLLHPPANFGRMILAWNRAGSLPGIRVSWRTSRLTFPFVPIRVHSWLKILVPDSELRVPNCRFPQQRSQSGRGASPLFPRSHSGETPLPQPSPSWISSKCRTAPLRVPSRASRFSLSISP